MEEGGGWGKVGGGRVEEGEGWGKGGGGREKGGGRVREGWRREGEGWRKGEGRVEEGGRSGVGRRVGVEEKDGEGREGGTLIDTWISSRISHRISGFQIGFLSRGRGN